MSWGPVAAIKARRSAFDHQEGSLRHQKSGPYDHRAFAFCIPEIAGDGLHYHSEQVCRFNGGVARTINERLKKHGLEHSPRGILTCGECEQESSLAKKNEVGK
jgi:hypothetical protein